MDGIYYQWRGGEKEGEKRHAKCVRKTNDRLRMQSMPLGKQLRREFRGVYTTVQEQENFHYPKTSKLNL